MINAVSNRRLKYSVEAVTMFVFWGLFGFAYTDYTNYTDIGLDPHQWLNTMPLHPAGGT